MWHWKWVMMLKIQLCITGNKLHLKYIHIYYNYPYFLCKYGLSFAVSPSCYIFLSVIQWCCNIHSLNPCNHERISCGIRTDDSKLSVCFGRLACCHEERGSEKVGERDRKTWRRVDDRVRGIKRNEKKADRHEQNQTNEIHWLWWLLG